MKKVKIVFLCFILSIGIMACGSSQIDSETNLANIEDDVANEIEEPHVEISEEEILEIENDETEELAVENETSEVEMNIQGPITLRGATFYPPLTRRQANEQGIEYDGLWEVGGVEFVTYDWVVGDDLMDEDEEVQDSDMTVDTYAEALGGHAATEKELNYLLANEPVLDQEYGFGWPETYWIGEWWGEPESDEDSNPLLYQMGEYPDNSTVAYDFAPFNFPVIVVVGEMYEPDFTGGMEMREKEITEDGNGYFVNMLWDVENEVEELMTIYVNENTRIFDEHGYLVDTSYLGSSQLSMEIIMDEAGEYAAKIYILPFSMW